MPISHRRRRRKVGSVARLVLLSRHIIAIHWCDARPVGGAGGERVPAPACKRLNDPVVYPSTAQRYPMTATPRSSQPRRVQVALTSGVASSRAAVGGDRQAIQHAARQASSPERVRAGGYVALARIIAWSAAMGQLTVAVIQTGEARWGLRSSRR